MTELSDVGLTDWVREDFLIAGRNDQYTFDLALVVNGHGVAAQVIETMALAKADTEATHRELDALGYSIYDVRANQIQGPFALVVAPDTSRDLVRLAERILSEFDGEVIDEANATNWVAAVSKRVLAHEPH
jgi:hypothetical protein